MTRLRYCCIVITILCNFVLVHSSDIDITSAVFGSLRDGMPAAFGDFNSDELTDVFVLRNNRKTVEVLLAAEEEPLLRPKGLLCNFKETITSVVPGDFDGDAFMDILVTTSFNHDEFTNVYIIWGGLDHVNCSDEQRPPVIQLHGQPLAIDYDQNMIIDLFGLDEFGNRTFWQFNSTRDAPPTKHPMSVPDDSHGVIRQPHSHAYLDLNGDYTADLFLTTGKNFEIWYGIESNGFVYNRSIKWPNDAKFVGQSLFIDVELIGRADLVTVVCLDDSCERSAILVYAAHEWHNLQVNFKDNANVLWKFPKPEKSKLYRDTVTLRSGDFNMDGYPDLLVTLVANRVGSAGHNARAFLLENVACETGCGAFSRTYVIRWDALNPLSNGSIMAVFYDFFQDGILDVIVVRENATQLTVGAFKNSLDYDANFIKVSPLNRKLHIILLDKPYIGYR